MLKLAIRPLTIDDFIQMIRNIPGFAFARYGDGTFFCMQGHKGQNCDGVEYTPEQASSLIATLRDRTIYHGIGDLALSAANAEPWLEQQGIDLEWYDANVMHTASERGQLLPFVKFLQKRKIIFCGPSHLKKFQAFKPLHFVECHPTNAFGEIDALEAEISYRIEQHQADTVLVSAGLGAAPTLVSRLHREFPTAVVLDTGSVWDPYCGVLSRRPHRRRGWEGTVKLAQINLGMDIRKW